MKPALTTLARAHGFDAVGFASADVGQQLRADLQQFIAEGRHGEMEWLARNPEVRADPKTLWPEAKSVIVVGMNYAPDHNPLDALAHKKKGVISVYAQNRDYHDVLKGRLKQLAGQMVAKFGGEVKVFVDTAPVMEKPLAALSGIGWVGKHTCIVSREFGSWLFLGVIFTTLDIPADTPEPDHCGSCRACLDICPTQAFTSARQIDARRCISYLTIEHKGHIPEEFRAAMGNRIYGCDDCLAVCPWNKFAQTAQTAAFHARDDLRSPSLGFLLTLEDADFRTFFSGSPIKRIGRDRFIRNVLIAAGNSEDTSLLPQVRGLMVDPAEIVQEAACWAKARLEKSGGVT
jgi:epoxyqueuosine reductase